MGPAISWTKLSKSKKVHTCCECPVPIQPGDRYERTTGVWDGEFSTFKTCLPCQRLREIVLGWFREQDWECSIEFGRVQEEFQYAQRDGLRLHPLQQLAMQAP